MSSWQTTTSLLEIGTRVYWVSLVVQETGQCNCHNNAFGRQCDECRPGYWSFPDCRQCQVRPCTAGCLGCGYDCPQTCPHCLIPDHILLPAAFCIPVDHGPWCPMPPHMLTILLPTLMPTLISVLLPTLLSVLLFALLPTLLCLLCCLICYLPCCLLCLLFSYLFRRLLCYLLCCLLSYILCCLLFCLLCLLFSTFSVAYSLTFSAP